MRKTTLAAICIAVLTLAGAVAALAAASRAQVAASYERNSSEIDQPYGGSVPWSKLERHPEARELYRGIGFGTEFNASRGHTCARADVVATSRPKSTAGCWSCKSANVPAVIEAVGEEAFYASSFENLKGSITETISCANCHSEPDMQRAITSPALVRGLAGIGMDAAITTQDDMKMLACAQCHVEYYFAKPGNVLTFPWAQGTTPADIERYYESIDFVDWVHPGTGYGMIKVQHPEFETFTADSLHYQFGLACADCHMPATASPDGEYPSHWWTSPLNHLGDSCGGCHGDTDADLAELRANLIELQAGIDQQRTGVGRLLAGLYRDIEAAGASGGLDRLNESARVDLERLCRRAQFRWDWTFSENSTGFHNPDLIRAMLTEAQQMTEQARAVLSAYAGH